MFEELESMLSSMTDGPKRVRVASSKSKEEQLDELVDFFLTYQQGNPFKAGDLVFHDPAYEQYMVSGPENPAVVIRTFEPGSKGQKHDQTGDLEDMTIALCSDELGIVMFDVESFRFKKYEC